MVQKKSKDAKLEIVLDLIAKKENHVRGLSAAIATPHATVIRKCAELLRESVIDYKTEGRNKVFFLKKSPQAKSYAYMAETYRFSEFLKAYPDMVSIVAEIAKAAQRSSMVLIFGSYAKLRAKKDSDIDVFAEHGEPELREKLKQIDRRINTKTGAFDTRNKLVQEMIKSHVILRGVERFYDKTGLFE